MLTEVLCVQATIFTSASVNKVFLSSINIWIVMSVEAGFLSLILFLYGEYTRPHTQLKQVCLLVHNKLCETIYHPQDVLGSNFLQIKSDNFIEGGRL